MPSRIKLSAATQKHNRWLADNTEGTQLDLKDVQLETEVVRGRGLQSAVFENVVFDGLEFVDCDLTGASFFNCTFSACKFTKCTLHKSEFHGCVFERLRASECAITKTEWYGGDLRSASLADCDLSWSYFQSVDLRSATIARANLEGSVWDKTKTHGAKFDAVSLGTEHPAKVSGTDLSADGTGQNSTVSALWVTTGRVGHA